MWPTVQCKNSTSNCWYITLQISVISGLNVTHMGGFSLILQGAIYLITPILIIKLFKVTIVFITVHKAVKPSSVAILFKALKTLV